MIFSCNPGCKKGTTSASYDRETGEVICDKCTEVLQNISVFAKNNLKLSGPYTKKKKKAFEFKCLTCNKIKQAQAKDGKITRAIIIKSETALKKKISF